MEVHPWNHPRGATDLPPPLPHFPPHILDSSRSAAPFSLDLGPKILLRLRELEKQNPQPGRTARPPSGNPPYMSLSAEGLGPPWAGSWASITSLKRVFPMFKASWSHKKAVG